MIWSKLKKATQGLLANALLGRVEYHLTRYGPGVSQMMTRGWITHDRREIINFSTIKLIRSYHEVSGDWWPDTQEDLEELHNQYLFTRQEYVNALEEYISLKVDDALCSANPLIRAFAMFDRRVGKRRLAALEFKDEPSPLVRKFYRIGCEAEGIVLGNDHH